MGTHYKSADLRISETHAKSFTITLISFILFYIWWSLIWYYKVSWLAATILVGIPTVIVLTYRGVKNILSAIFVLAFSGFLAMYGSGGLYTFLVNAGIYPSVAFLISVLLSIFIASGVVSALFGKQVKELYECLLGKVVSK